MSINEMSKGKTLLYTYWNNGQVFYDQDNNIITYIHENDGDYSEEYFNIILNHFGVNVEFVENTPQFIKDEYPDDEYDNDDDNDDDDDDFFEKNW